MPWVGRPQKRAKKKKLSLRSRKRARRQSYARLVLMYSAWLYEDERRTLKIYKFAHTPYSNFNSYRLRHNEALRLYAQHKTVARYSFNDKLNNE